MHIFVNNKPVEILKKSENLSIQSGDCDKVYDIINDFVPFSNLKGRVLIKSADYTNILRFIEFAQKNKLEDLISLKFEVEDKAKIKNKIKSSLSVIKAAGGIVINHENKILMMKRLGFWDLPKGKADLGEKSKETANREVEEECGIKVNVNEKICTTWHTYLLKGNLVIKQTKWFSMDLINDKKMKPQTEEGIEELKWMTKDEVKKALEKSYSSIEYVIQTKFPEINLNKITLI